MVTASVGGASVVAAAVVGKGGDVLLVCPVEQGDHAVIEQIEKIPQRRIAFANQTAGWPSRLNR